MFKAIPLYLLGISFLIAASLSAADYTNSGYSNSGSVTDQNQHSRQPVRYRTGHEQPAVPSLEYYPNYYGDDNYYFNTREEYGPRMGDWDYHNRWHYHSREYLRGYTQSDFYRERHPYGPGGIGYDPDDAYLRMYNEISQGRAGRQKTNSDNELIAGETRSNKRERARYDSSNYSYERPAGSQQDTRESNDPTRK